MATQSHRVDALRDLPAGDAVLALADLNRRDHDLDDPEIEDDISFVDEWRQDLDQLMSSLDRAGATSAVAALLVRYGREVDGTPAAWTWAEIVAGLRPLLRESVASPDKVLAAAARPQRPDDPTGDDKRHDHLHQAGGVCQRVGGDPTAERSCAHRHERRPWSRRSPRHKSAM
ncbi:hypothetical protein [Actinophytocola sp.]|uniref:hypothetical protein n=1 Tax=Actinophytocola sp. TaxID=1872138 RepID=UPI00389AB6B0